MIRTTTTKEIELEPSEVMEAINNFAQAKHPDLAWDSEVTTQVSTDADGDVTGATVILTKKH